MITTRMSSSELLKEYWKDYETIRERIYNFLNKTTRKLKELQGNKDWYMYKEPRHAKINWNDYYTILEARYNKKAKCAEFLTTTYTTIRDADTGVELNILFPADEKIKCVVIIESRVIKRTGLTTFDFMKSLGALDLNINNNYSSDFNVYGKLFDDLYCFGKFEEENNRFILKRVYKVEDINKLTEEYGGENYLESYIKYRDNRHQKQVVTKPSIEIPTDVPDEELTKEQQMELAWRMYTFS